MQITPFLKILRIRKQCILQLNKEKYSFQDAVDESEQKNSVRSLYLHLCG